jgi:CRISPR-associated protein Csh1
MIEHFKSIGRSVLESNGYAQAEDPCERRRAFLSPLTLIPYSPKDRVMSAICIDFDLEKKTVKFFEDKELIIENREYFFALKVGASNDKKKFLCTNQCKSLLNNTFIEIPAYLKDKRQEEISSQWFAENVSTKYDQLIKDIKNIFFDEKVIKTKNSTKTITVINPERLEEEDRIRIARISQKEAKPEKIYEKLFLEKFSLGKNENLPSIYLIKINGKHIMEHPDPDIRSAYLAVAYYDLYLRFEMEGIHPDKFCHSCGQTGDVAGKLPLPMKFYGITNRLYFENTNNKNAYKSFGLCRECMGHILVGMKYTESQLKQRLFDMSCYLVPCHAQNGIPFEAQLKKIIGILEKKGGYYRDDIQAIGDLLKKSQKRRTRFRFNLLFFHSVQSEFNILRYIADIELRELMEKMESFDHWTNFYQLHLIGKRDNSFNLRNIRDALFPPHQPSPNNKKDFSIYGKSLLNFLDNFLSNRPLSYRDMIGRFTSIYRRQFLRSGNADRYSPLKMVCFFTILLERNLLKEETGMNRIQPNTEILKQEYKDFFTTHAGVYEANMHRQGLFLLGAVISRIVNEQKRKHWQQGKLDDEQRKKEDNRPDTSTFLKKINFDGIMPRRVHKLVGEVRKYAVIYPIFQEPELWGNITDRLQGIDISPIKPDEVVFYILTGISFESYLGIKNRNEKNLKETQQGEDNGEK